MSPSPLLYQQIDQEQFEEENGGEMGCAGYAVWQGQRCVCLLLGCCGVLLWYCPVLAMMVHK